VVDGHNRLPLADAARGGARDATARIANDGDVTDRLANDSIPKDRDADGRTMEPRSDMMPSRRSDSPSTGAIDADPVTMMADATEVAGPPTEASSFATQGSGFDELPGLAPGAELDGRYALISLIHSRGPVNLWRGDDRILARPVAVRVVAHAGGVDPSASTIAAHALLAAAINSGRLVHPGAASTYDATTTATDIGDVSYVVTEWVEGVTLRQLADEGTLRPDRAAAVVQAAARVIAAAHDRGVTHGDLHPSDVVLSGHGMVKVVDLEVGGVMADLEAGRRPTTAGSGAAEDRLRERMSADVQALGALLYSALAGRWPLPGDGGLPNAPVGPDGTVVTASQLRLGVPEDLDDIALATLGDPRAGRAPIVDAATFVAELEPYVPADGTLDPGLTRVDDEPGLGSTQVFGNGDGYGGRDGYGGADGYGGRDGYGGGWDAETSLGPRGGTDPRGGRPGPGYGPPNGARGGYRAGPPSGRAQTGPDRYEPYRQPAPPARGGRTDRRWIALVLVAVIIAVAVVVSVVVTRGGGGNNKPNAAQTLAPAPVPVRPVHTDAFDPMGDNKEGRTPENATDGDTTTVWSTEGYNPGAPFGGLKHPRDGKVAGVGLLFDFGQAYSFSQVTATVQGQTAMQVWASDSGGTDLANYAVVGTGNPGSGTVNITVTNQTPHRYWVLWLTSIPLQPDAGNGKYQGRVAEVTFTPKK